MKQTVRETYSLLVGLQVSVAVEELNLQVSQNIKKAVPYDTTILLLGITQRTPHPTVKTSEPPMFVAALFTIANNWNHPYQHMNG